MADETGFALTDLEGDVPIVVATSFEYEAESLCKIVAIEMAEVVTVLGRTSALVA